MAILAAVRDWLRTRAALQVEVLALRHQLNVLQRYGEATESDRCGSISVGPVVAVLERLAVCPGHRETGDGDCLAPQRVSVGLDLEGAPRIHGALLKLGIDIGETSVGKYMARGRKPPSQTWPTFLENHFQATVSVDFFTVPTIR